MTTYTASPEAIQEYYSACHRTQEWVSNLKDTQCLSPSAPRSELSDDDEVLSISVSDVESSHSIPPKLMLRYGDGRPDVPIPHVHDEFHDSNRSAHKNPASRSQTFPHSSHQSFSGTNSHSRAPSSQAHGYGYPHQPQVHPSRTIPNVPEEIRILPSQPLGSGSMAGTHHTRSKSLPKNAFHSSSPSRHRDRSFSQQQPIISKPIYPAPAPTNTSPGAWHSVPMGGSHPPLMPNRGKNPPSIIYAPSHHSRNHYRPPVIYTHPPNVGPNGVIYSHSAPIPPGPPLQYTASAYPPAGVHRDGDSKRAKGRNRSGSTERRPSRGRSGSSPYPYRGGMNGDSESPTASTPSLASGDSGSTYYVIPTGKQKVHVLRPPDLVLDTSSSPTTTHSRSPATPLTSTSGASKKSFFQRLFPFTGKLGSSKASSQGTGRRLHRRHSTGSSDRGHVGSPVTKRRA